MKLFVHKDHLQKAHDILWIAFRWQTSIKQFAFWKSVAAGLQYNGAIDNGSHGNAYIQPENIIKSCNEFLVHLDAAFKWADSPQGTAFWVEVHDAVLDVITLHAQQIKKPNKDHIKAYDEAMKGI